LFTDIPGKTDVLEHNIELLPETKPIRMSPYRANPQKMELIKKELKEMESLGLIETSSSPWASPIILVPKPDNSIRFVVDYRKVNAVTVPSAYPIARVDDLIDKVGNAKFLTKIDLLKSYYQIRLSEESIPISAFVTPFGQFQWKYMPFGLRNAPSTFTRLMQIVLNGLEEFTGAYLDDIIIFSRTWTEHKKHLRQVFDRLRKANLTVRKSKCTFATAQCEFLGHVIGLNSIKPRQIKVDALLQFPRPNNRKQLQQFLGLANYYRKFIPHMSHITSELNQLLKKGRIFKWTQETETAFTEIKSRLASYPILRPPDFSKQFSLAVDSSNTACGAYLFQIIDDIEHPICYYSKSLDTH